MKNILFWKTGANQVVLISLVLQIIIFLKSFFGDYNKLCSMSNWNYILLRFVKRDGVTVLVIFFMVDFSEEKIMAMDFLMKKNNRETRGGLEGGL